MLPTAPELPLLRRVVCGFGGAKFDWRGGERRRRVFVVKEDGKQSVMVKESPVGSLLDGDEVLEIDGVGVSDLDHAVFMAGVTGISGTTAFMRIVRHGRVMSLYIVRKPVAFYV